MERRCPRLTVFSGQGNPIAETRSEECLRVRKCKVDLVLPRLTPPMTPGFLTPNIPTSFLLCSQPPPPLSVWPDHLATPPSGIFTRSPRPKDELQLAFKALCGQEYSLFPLPKPPPPPRKQCQRCHSVKALPFSSFASFTKPSPPPEGPLSESSPPFRAQLNPHPKKPALMTTVSRGHSSAPSLYPMYSPPPKFCKPLSALSAPQPHKTV